VSKKKRPEPKVELEYPEDKGLGEGFGQLFGTELPEEEVINIPIDKVIPNPNQPRRRMDPEGLRGLADTIREQGLVQNIIVRPIKDENGDIYYQIVAGERRWRAGQIAGLSTIRAEIRDLDEKQTIETSLIENLQREELLPLDEAVMYERMVKELGYTQKEIANIIGKGINYISQRMVLLEKLSDEVKDKIENSPHGESLSFSSLRAVSKLPKNQQADLIEEVVDKDLTVVEVTKRIKLSKVKTRTEREKREREASKWMTKIKRLRDNINRLLEEKKDIELSSKQRNELKNIIDDLCHNLYVEGFE